MRRKSAHSQRPDPRTVQPDTRRSDVPTSSSPLVNGTVVDGTLPFPIPAADATLEASPLPPGLDRWLARNGAATAVCSLLAVLLVIVFGQTLWADFIDLDDAHYVFQNSHVRDGLSWGGIAWSFSHRYQANWHPLTWISHMLDWQLFGPWAGGHHLTSIVLHALTAMVLFLALRRLTGRMGPSALVAILFAIHPLRAESVAWVAERKDVLSGLFFALALWAYARYVARRRGVLSTQYLVPTTESGVANRESQGQVSEPAALGPDNCVLSTECCVPGTNHGTYWYALVWILFALGLMAKPMLVTLPFVLLLLDFWPLRRTAGVPALAGDCGKRRLKSILQLFVEKLPFFTLSVTSCAVTIWAQSEALEDLGVHSLAFRAANALVACGQYVRTTVWPANLAVFYPFPKDSWPVWLVVASGAAVLGISLAAIATLRRLPWVATGWFWFLGMLVPVIGLVQVGTQARADRYTYLPQIGLLVALVWTADAFWRWRRLGRRSALAVSALLIVTLTVCAVRQVSYWRNTETLWQHTIASTVENARAHANLASVLGRRKAYPQAIEQFKIALQADSNQPGWLNNYSITLREAGQLDEAIRVSRLAVEQRPDNSTFHQNLAESLLAGGLADEAIRECRRGLENRAQLPRRALPSGSGPGQPRSGR